MRAFLLSIHVIAAIVLIGPITAAASVFPRYARVAAAAESVDTPAAAVAAAMHRISRGYALPAVAVPVFGIALGGSMGVLRQTWLVTAMLLTAVAAALLVARIVPAQAEILQRLSDTDSDVDSGPVVLRLARQLSMWTGLFALAWAVVVIFMIVRPGSSTHV